MINRIKLILLDQAKQMRKFKRKDAVGFESYLQSFDKIVQIGNLGQDIVSQYQVGSAFGLHQIPRSCDAEELDKSANSLLCRHLGHIRRGFDPENGDTVLDKVL